MYCCKHDGDAPEDRPEAMANLYDRYGKKEQLCIKHALDNLWQRCRGNNKLINDTFGKSE